MENSASQNLSLLAWDQMLQNPRRALELSLKALEAVQTTGDEASQVESWHDLGWSHFYLSEQSEALGCFTNALEIALKFSNRPQEANSRIGLGAVYQQLSRFDLALEHLTEAYKIAQTEGADLSEMQAGIHIGEVHLSLGKPQEALEYFLQAQNLAKKTNQKNALAEILLSLGQTFITLRRNDQALEQLSRALVLTKELSNKIGEARALTHIGLIYRDIHELEISEEYHLESLKICQTIDHKWGQLEACSNLGDLHLLRGHKEVAYKYYEKVITLSALLDSKFYTTKTYQRLAEFWEKSEDYKKALEYSRQAYALERELKADETTQRVRSLKTQYEFEKNKAQAEILRLKTDHLEKQSRELQKALDSLRVISELGRRITSCLKAGQLVQTVYEALVELMEVTAFSLFLYAPRKKSVRSLYRLENGQVIKGELTFSIDETLVGRAISTKKILLIKDAQVEAYDYLPKNRADEYLAKTPYRSLIFLPLLGEKVPFGALAVQHTNPQVYNEQHCRFLETLGGFITVALRNMLNHRRARNLNQELEKEKLELQKANQQIQHMAHHDLLTGLANRRLLSDFLAKTIPYCQRKERGFALYFLDLNGFKPINDSWGHDAGDWVLSQLGVRLSGVLRDSDLVARVGGDEFVALALEIEDREQAEVVASKLIQSIEEPLDWMGNSLVLGVSIGISLFPEDGQDVERLLNRADDAMYQVKRTQKSGWSFFQP